MKCKCIKNYIQMWNLKPRSNGKKIIISWGGKFEIPILKDNNWNYKSLAENIEICLKLESMFVYTCFV